MRSPWTASCLRSVDELEVEHPGFRFYRSPVKELWQEPAPASGNDVTEWPPVRERRASTPSASLNTILYGPPGTGKTYRTFRRCVEICDGRTLEGRELRARYEALVDEGRIKFVTFHQSYGYEEFVEGIRPVEKDGQVVYRVEPGILRTLAKAARHARTVAAPTQVPLHRPFDLAQGEEAGVELATGAAALPHITRAVRTAKYALEGSYRQPKRDSIIDRIYHALRQFGEPMTGDDLVIKVHGFTRPESGKVMAEGAIASTLRWLVQKERLHVVVPANVGAVPRSEAQEPAPPSEPPNFVLVIDEINRANISKVMGELITLLEEDKREGAENEVTVTLPYSREPFALPPNLHILGTMNTAGPVDRPAGHGPATPIRLRGGGAGHPAAARCEGADRRGPASRSGGHERTARVPGRSGPSDRPRLADAGKEPVRPGRNHAPEDHPADSGVLLRRLEQGPRRSRRYGRIRPAGRNSGAPRPRPRHVRNALQMDHPSGVRRGCVRRPCVGGWHGSADG